MFGMLVFDFCWVHHVCSWKHAQISTSEVATCGGQEREKCHRVEWPWKTYGFGVPESWGHPRFDMFCIYDTFETQFLTKCAHVGVMNWPRISSVCDLSELAGDQDVVLVTGRMYSTNTSSDLKLNIEITKTYIDQPEAALLWIICVAFSPCLPNSRNCDPIRPADWDDGGGFRVNHHWYQQRLPGISGNIGNRWGETTLIDGLPTFRAQLLPQGFQVA